MIPQYMFNQYLKCEKPIIYLKSMKLLLYVLFLFINRMPARYKISQISLLFFFSDLFLIMEYFYSFTLGKSP